MVEKKGGGESNNTAVAARRGRGALTTVFHATIGPGGASPSTGMGEEEEVLH